MVVLSTLLTEPFSGLSLKDCPWPRAESGREIPRSLLAHTPNSATLLGFWLVKNILLCSFWPYLIFATFNIFNRHIMKDLSFELCRLHWIVSLTRKFSGVEPLSPPVRSSDKLDTGLEADWVNWHPDADLMDKVRVKWFSSINFNEVTILNPSTG